MLGLPESELGFDPNQVNLRLDSLKFLARFPQLSSCPSSRLALKGHMQFSFGFRARGIAQCLSSCSIHSVQKETP
jgi:hypothetical protein